MPRYVLLALFAVGIGYLYNNKFDIGIPFGEQLHFFTLDYRGTYSSTVWIGGSGSRPVRGGLHGRDRPRRHPLGRQGPGRGGPGPGHERGKTMRRVVLPQAMRVIVPPTGNETIAMVKDTSLFIAAPDHHSSSTTRRPSSAAGFKIMPGLMAATLWYLIVCSVLMVGQSYLEKYFGRGFGAPCRRRPSRRS
jgi:polar amino acid transport system permease protein